MMRLLCAAASVALMTAVPALAQSSDRAAGAANGIGSPYAGEAPFRALAAHVNRRRTPRQAAPPGAPAPSPQQVTTGRFGNEYPYPYRNDDWSAIKPDRW